MKTMSFNPLEKRALLGLASITFLRMFGLFLVMPIISLYANGLVGATPVLVGLALGGYGLTQSFLQIPFGLYSDRYGRKPMIFLGLSLFGMGSLFAAFSHTIWGLITGRVLQGCGAISSVVIAYLADLTREEQRTKAMALMGMTIGTTFLLATIFAPVLQSVFGVQGIFFLATFLALVCMSLLFWALPQPLESRAHQDIQVRVKDIPGVMLDSQLWRLNVSIFILHAVLAMTFVCVPFLIKNQVALTHSLSPEMQKWIYAPILLISFICIFPLMMMAERKGRNKQVMNIAILSLSFAFAVLGFFGYTLSGLLVGLFLFFASFNLLEAMLPSWISRVAPKQYKGTALGIYSSSQFLGLFCGGIVSGVLMAKASMYAVFTVAALCCVIWLWLVRDLQNYKKNT